MTPPRERMTVAQVAAFLGVKPASVYAYVSRGLLKSVRAGGGSTFDPLDVERFARSRGAAGGRGAAPALPAFEASIAHIEDGRLLLRGRPLADLARHHRFEDVARLLWGGELAEGEPFAVSEGDVAAARTVVRSLPALATGTDRIAAAVISLGASDPLRHAGGDAIRSGTRLIAGTARAIRPGAGSGSGEWIAELLWPSLTDAAPTARGVATLDSAMVLLIEHGLAVSTLAARVAASARAPLSAGVLSALGAMDSPLHGDASQAASLLLRRVLDGTGAREALAETVAMTGRGAPGFGQPVHATGDPRAVVLLDIVRELEGASPVIAAADELSAVVADASGERPNIDLALAAFTLVCDCRPHAASAIFAIARMGGWVAHMMDEYERSPMRLRPRGTAVP